MFWTNHWIGEEVGFRWRSPVYEGGLRFHIMYSRYFIMKNVLKFVYLHDTHSPVSPRNTKQMLRIKSLDFVRNIMQHLQLLLTINN